MALTQVVQFGYITLFASAFPLAGALALVRIGLGVGLGVGSGVGVGLGAFSPRRSSRLGALVRLGIGFRGRVGFELG